MPNFISLVDLLPLIPELILFLTLVVAMLADLFVPSNRRNDVLVSVSLGGIVLTMLAELQLYGAGYTGFYGTCLLYTSPSPRDMRRSRMPSSA